MALHAKIEVSGNTRDDVIAGLEEALRQVREGYLTGFNRNEDGHYHFEIDGEETPQDSE